MMKKTYFNLIEIILALGIILIGVVSLMGLFPLAARTVSNASLEMQTSTSAEEMVAFIQQDLLQTEWGSNVLLNKIPTTEPSLNLKDSNISHEEYVLLNADSKIDAIDAKWTSGKNSYLDNGKFYHFDSDASGVFMVVSGQGIDEDNTKNIKDINDSIETRCLMAIWQEPMERLVKKGNKVSYSKNSGEADSETSGETDFGVRINVKIQWPAEIPEASVDGGNVVVDDRVKTKIISFDVLNPDKRY